MCQKHPLGVEKVTTLVLFILESNPWALVKEINWFSLSSNCLLSPLLLNRDNSDCFTLQHLMNTEVCANEDINVKIYDTDQLKQVNMMTFLAGLFQPLF